ncbi:MAG: TRAP transporter small permease [Helicobacteraceae bacterium]
MKRIFTYLDLGIAVVNRSMAVVGMLGGILLATVNVFLRYLFNASLTWAPELTNYLFIWSALFGAAYGFKKGIHVQVTILLAKFKPSVAKFFMLFSMIFTFGYLALMSYLGISLIEVIFEMDEKNVELGIPMWIVNLVVPLAFFTASYRVGERIYEISRQDPKDVIKSNTDEFIHDSINKE